METITHNGKGYYNLGKHLWHLAGHDIADINQMLLNCGGRWNTAHYVAAKLKEAGYTCQEVNGQPLSMTSLIHLWLQG